MTVIVTENVPPRLRGRLGIWMLELRAGVFVGNLTKKHRDHIWFTIVEQVTLHHGSAVIAFGSRSNETGFEFDTVGENRRIPRRIDGISLISFLPMDPPSLDPPPPKEPEAGTENVKPKKKRKKRGRHKNT